MRGLTWLLPFQTDASQKTFVAQHAPELAPHLQIVPPVAPAPFRLPPSASGLHRLERLTRNQLTVKGGGKDQEHIRSQMSQILIPRLILSRVLSRSVQFQCG